MTASTRHRWSDKVRFLHKTEQQCSRCDVVKVVHHQAEGMKDIYWTEYWRDEEKIDCADATPACDARCEATSAVTNNLTGLARHAAGHCPQTLNPDTAATVPNGLRPEPASLHHHAPDAVVVDAGSIFSGGLR